MEGNVFINEALDISFKKYLDNKNNPDSEEFNSFLVVVVRILVFIYGELDIFNPYRANDIKGFDINLKKFGLSDDLLGDLKKQMLIFYQNKENEELLKSSFIKLQKILIDMFILKKSHVLVSDDEVEAFRKNLYSSDDNNEYKRNLYNRFISGSNEIMNYLNSRLFELKHNFVVSEFKEIALSKEAYQLAGYNAVEVMNMSDKDIQNINNKVFHFFRIKDSDLNKRKRLDSAINHYKRYGNTFSSGNGYVDTLLFAGFIATGIMLALLILMQLGG